MEFEDKIIECVECGAEFVHRADDQARYADRGFTSEPKRCQECRQERKARQKNRGGGGGGGRERGGFRGGDYRAPKELFDTVCTDCGVKTSVPFKPIEGRPVYCRDCFRRRRD